MAYLHGSNYFTNYSHRADTDFTPEAISTTIEYYKGTGVTYTPVAGATKVIIECDLQTSYSPDTKGNYPCVRVQYSTNSTNYVNGTWTDIPGTQCIEGNNSNNTPRDYQYHQFPYFFIIPVWTGERKIRLAGRSSLTSTEYTLGGSYDSLGSSGAGVGACPILSIYCEV